MSGIRRPGPAAGSDRGQTAVEFVGTWPFILLVVAAVWECVLIGYAFILVGNAADEASRAGAVHGSAACQAAAEEHIAASWGVTANCPRNGGHLYCASVTVKVPVLYPGLDLGGMTITARGGAVDERTED
ncbi:TadE/TadG family type IV pilus assembly protein [Streptomyces sp. NPDC101132]|uniref:TadE/TadG family type IV pilus assembly protein n=1 Tax=Streptomyces sp. NPDC101132 TaxID=3366110 RepID=UPI00381577E2